jgi:hypothetical protein
MRGGGVRLLIMGAGIAGLTAARTLRKDGAVEIVERVPDSTIEGSGIYLPGKTGHPKWPAPPPSQDTRPGLDHVASRGAAQILVRSGRANRG